MTAMVGKDNKAVNDYVKRHHDMIQRCHEQLYSTISNPDCVIRLMCDTYGMCAPHILAAHINVLLEHRPNLTADYVLAKVGVLLSAPKLG